MQLDEVRPRLSILIVDDHDLIRQGLRRLLEGMANEGCVADLPSGGQALDLLRRQTFDMAIIDLSLPDMNGLQFVRRARQEHPGLRLLMLSVHDDEQYAIRALKAGAHGYLSKDCSSGELLSAVCKVVRGGEYVGEKIAERLARGLAHGRQPPGLARLSDRELDVMQRLIAGQRISDIAQSLHLSAKTVSTHKGRILERLQLPSLAALIRYGIEQGMTAAEAQPPCGESPRTGPGREDAAAPDPRGLPGPSAVDLRQGARGRSFGPPTGPAGQDPRKR